MNILVCVKQVPDTTQIKIDPVKHTLIREGVPAILNPFDGYALEAAARVKDKDPSTKITVVTMGPPQAEDALREVFASHEPHNVTCEDVLRVVSSYYNVTPEDLKGPRRNREITVPRQIAMYLCRELTDCSMSRIGDTMGGRDHTTVLHGCDKVAEDLRTSESLGALMDDLRHALQNK